MGKENVVYIDSGILLRLKDGGYCLLWHMDKSGGHYSHWNEPNTESLIPKVLIYEEAKKVELTEGVEWVTRWWKPGKNGKLLIKR